MLRNCLISSFSLGLALLVPTLAHAEECGLDTDCPADQVCVDLSCGNATEPVDECESNADCHVGACTDGFCKREGVQCEDENGSHCAVYPSSFECLCANGVGFGGAGGSPGPDEPMPEPDAAELYGECLDNLAMCEGLGGDGDGDGDGDDDDDDDDNSDDDEGGDGDAEPGGENEEAVGEEMTEGRGCSTTGIRADGDSPRWLGLRRRRD